MCFSVTSGSPCSRRGSQPGHIKRSGCEAGRGCAGTPSIFRSCRRLRLTLHAAHGTRCKLRLWLEMPIKSLICFMWFNEQPRLQLAKRDTSQSTRRGRPHPKVPTLLAANHCSQQQQQQSHGGTWGSVLKAPRSTHLVSHPPPRLLMHFCVVSTTIN